MRATSATAPARDAGTFTPAVATWMIAAALASAAAFVMLLAFASRPGTGAHVQSRSAIGYAALVKLLRAEGTPVRMSSTLDLRRAAPGGVLVLTPDVGRRLGPLPHAPLGHLALIVAPKWMTAPYSRRQGWVFSLGLYLPGAVTANVLAPLTGDAWSGARAPSSGPIQFDKEPFLARRPGLSRPVLQDADGFFSPGTRITPAPIRDFQVFTRLPPGWERGLVDEQGRTVVAFDRNRRLFVASDPDLFNTQGLATLEGATAASRLIDALRAGDDPVVFDLTLSGVGGGEHRDRYNALRLVLTPPFLPATLCGLAAALLMGLHAAIPFGGRTRAARAFAFGKRALADNSAALIHMARRDAAMAPRYAAMSRAIVLESLPLERSDDAAATTARLDRVGEARGVEARFSDLERDAGRVADGGGLLASARALYRWRLEMTRGR